MNKSITTLALLVMMGSTAVQAQHRRSYNQPTTQVGAKVGLNMAVLDGTLNQETEFKAGPSIGAFLRWKPSARFAVQPELTYSAQGSKNVIPVGPVDLTNKTNLAYLNLPILAKIYLGNVVNVQFGPQVGILLSGRLKGQTSYTSSGSGSYYTTSDMDVAKSYRSDLGLCGGVGIDLPSGLLVAARLNYGLTDIVKDENVRQLREAYGIGGLHNRVLEFSVGYAFGGR
ncbi:PorT family protein [Hymenobacter aerilatus]|uniref:PorT family protein n=1 Tax=Hymenobacter aerilatus TaxID=2932251 RepID=A0A8T9SRU8_9BACT|nr:porin family protein [Hymenobacter aerilatus]UOR04545.1 PorT family protein [Hymenobacter aerilatus]